jgi:long-chain acyl-CoA synthetase
MRTALNLSQVLRRTAKRRPHHAAIVDCDSRRTFSYGEMLAEIDRLAAEFAAAGVCPGDCIALHIPSGRNYLLATYALWSCGACVVPIPIELAPPEKRQIFERIALNGAVTSAGGAGFARPYEKHRPTSLSLGMWVPTEPTREHPAGFQELNAAFIRFSSGTTGASKGVVLSHETIYERIHAANEGLRLTAEDRVVWLLSMSYHFTATIVAYLTFGATIILPRRSVNLGKSIVEAAADHAGTFLYGSPSQYELMAADRSGRMLDQVRLAISTATSLPRTTAQAFHRRFNVHLSQVYGIIEIGLPCANVRYAGERCDSVGEVLPAFELRLVDSGGDGGSGEIEFRGPGFLDAYYDPWQVRSEITTDGWFNTGDLGDLDDLGCLSIQGRSKEMINVSGMKVFPQEVEAALQSHPAVVDAIAFPVRRFARSEAVWASVVVDPSATNPPTEAELRRYCAKSMAHFKVPERIQFVTELGRTASGKKLRRAVESKR